MDSSQYHQVLLSAVDDHCREGYFSYPGSLEEVLEKICNKNGNSWKTHYECPIHELLTEAGHEIHYG